MARCYVERSKWYDYYLVVYTLFHFLNRSCQEIKSLKQLNVMVTLK